MTQLTLPSAEPTVTVTEVTGGRLYTRVFESILDSSINVQRVPPSARWLWITMLLIADKNRTGVVDMPVERLAAKAGLTVDQTLEGLAILSAPDIESRSDEEEGRRIVPIRDGAPRGWLLVNWQKYKDIAKEEQEREATRQRVAAYRKKKSGNADVTERNGDDVTSNASEASTDAATASTKRKTAARDLVEGFTLTDEHREWARVHCPSVPLDEELDAWKDRMRQTGYRAKAGLVKDAQASFYTSCRNNEAWGTYLRRSGTPTKKTRQPADPGEGFEPEWR